MAPTVAHVNGSVAHAVKRTVANSPCRRRSRGGRFHRHKAVQSPESCRQIGMQQRPAQIHCETKLSVAANTPEKTVQPHWTPKDHSGGILDQTDKSSVLNGHPGDSCAAFLEKEDRAAAAAATLLARVHAGKAASASSGPRPAASHRGALTVGVCAGKARRACFNDAATAANVHEGVYSSEHVAVRACGRGQRVHFDDRATVVHEVEPYAEIYGRHPRLFVFDRNSEMIPAAPGGFVSLQAAIGGDEEDEDILSDEQPKLSINNNGQQTSSNSIIGTEVKREDVSVEDEWEAFLLSNGGTSC